MDLIQAIMERRSIRKFKKKPISREVIENIIKTAIWAPSGSNMQAWKFIIVDEHDQLQKLKLFSPGLLGDPPTVIVISIDLKLAEKKAGKLGVKELAFYDAALVGQNISLAALEYKLGTCLVASFSKIAIQELLHLPENIKPYLILTIGYPETIPVPPPRKPISEMIFWQKYNKEMNGFE
ncbi:MAG: nitroreductase family protein [Firmicutes bacterium]|jgi:nitroreductase|nr:nitroreductase family protein [Bacillota bacterium]